MSKVNTKGLRFITPQLFIYTEGDWSVETNLISRGYKILKNDVEVAGYSFTAHDKLVDEPWVQKCAEDGDFSNEIMRHLLLVNHSYLAWKNS